mgnify:FL=1
MINVSIVCIGKLKEGYLREASAEYAKRLGRFCRFSVRELPEKQTEGKSEADIAAVKRAEGERIVGAVKGHVIALDGRGKQISSEELAELLKKKAQTSSEIDFVIGGSYGLSDEVRARADEVISFGRITFPHQLIRIVAQEQIYRAFTINAGITYHK